MTTAQEDFPTSFLLEDYFIGHTRAHGAVQDRFGRIHRQFAVDMFGQLDAGVLVLDEQFHFSDGATSSRTWRVRRIAPNRYEGTADDVIGHAIGIIAGNCIRWRYALRLKISGRYFVMRFRDTMLLQPNGIVLNKAVFGKFGIRLGELFLSFQKREPNAADRSGPHLRLIARQ
jgi:hypothetical protein